MVEFHEGALGTGSSLLLRLGQTVFASASLLFMCLHVDFYAYSSFCYLVTVMGLVVPWTLTLAMVDIYSLILKKLPLQPRLISIIAVSDLVLSFLSLGAGCSSASVTDLLLDAGSSYCSAPMCRRYQMSAAMSVSCWFLLFLSSLLNIWLLPRFYVNLILL